MSKDIHVFVELLLLEGAAVAWGAWELWSLRRDKKKDAAKAAEMSSAQPGDEADRG